METTRLGLLVDARLPSQPSVGDSEMIDPTGAPGGSGQPPEDAPDDVEGHSLIEELARDVERQRVREAEQWARQAQVARQARRAADRPGIRQRFSDRLRGR